MNPTEPTLEESMGEILKQVPSPIRDFLTGPERDRVLSDLSTKYSLHVDQAGVFENQFISMLLGVIEPDAFMSALQHAGIADEVATGIAQDLNAQVFVPIRQKMRAQGSDEAPAALQAQPAAAPQPQAPRPAAKPLPPPPANLPGVMMPKAPAPPQAQAKPVTFATSFGANAAPMNAPVVPKPPAPGQAPQRAGLAGALKAAGVPLTSPQASQGTALLEDHEEAHIDFTKPAAPPPAPAPRAMPTTMPPVQPMFATPNQGGSDQVLGVRGMTKTQNLTPTTSPKSYAVDPYREQPEEHEK